ncbi:hypothetical protein B0H13DRAFT_2456110 [Mycena leptocephala]|nr:hypothetical protein B0H13DRAFT_2456110 [Mycena leptocephala]
MSSVDPAVTLSPLQENPPTLAVDRLVHVFHPKFKTGVPMLRFWTTEVGVPVGLILDACYVVAGNRSGKLYTHVEPRQQISEADADALLHAGEYVFVVLGSEEAELDDYGVCPSFRAWTPPTTIPDRWTGSKVVLDEGVAHSSNISAAVKQADGCCLLTRSPSGIESNHLVPKEEDAWFQAHYRQLQSYGGDAQNDLNSMRNRITLRADLNAQGFDAGQFILAPYAGKITALFLQPTYRDLAQKHHLQEVKFPTRIIRAIYGQVGPAAGVLNALEAVEVELKLQRKRKSSPLRGRRVKKVKTSGKAGQDEEDGNDDADMGSMVLSAGGDVNDTGSAPTENEELDSEGRLPTEDGMAPRINDPTLQGLLEEQDKVLQARSFLTEDDVAAGRYPGFSAINRLALKWVANHPQISAVRNPHQIAPE